MTATHPPVSVSLDRRPPHRLAPGASPGPSRDVLQLSGDFALTHGGRLSSPRLAFEQTGEGPPVVALGGISAGRHLTATSEDPSAGWWSAQVGAGQAIDTRAFRALSFDYLGGNGNSSGPRSATAAEEFPAISTSDQARALAALLDALEIPRLHALVGASYGGMVALAFAALYPQRVERLVVLSAADRAHPMATAWRSLQRRIVRLALSQDLGEQGLALSRGLAMTTYRSGEEFAERFAGPVRFTERGARFPVEGYLEARGRDFARDFDPHAFLRLSESLDLHSVDPRRVSAPTTLVAVRSDQIVPLAQMQALARRLAGPSRLVEIASPYGHDAFLKEIRAVGSILRGALAAEGGAA